MTTQNEETQLHRKHIFVVNGDPVFLELLRELLQDRRFNVTTTNFVPRTFEQIESLGPCLILVDLAIGQQAGWELLERLQDEAVTRHVPIIVTSTDPRLLQIAEQNKDRYGEGTYVSKPMDVRELRDTIEELIGQA